MPVNTIREFLQKESSSGLLIIGAAVFAMLAENTLFKTFYDALLGTPVGVRVGTLAIDKPLLLWINDGLMAVFFFLVGLEIKRELLDGELSDPARIVLPAVAAVGGMVVPASIFVYFNHGDPQAMTGWAIPMATDIAFALGILSLLGRRVPVSLKLFLLTLAIIDDLGAIIIIALFYSSDISIASLVVSAVALTVLFIINRSGVTRIAPYMLLGLVLWVAVLKSGVHATLAGVVLAFFIPLTRGGDYHNSPLHHLEHILHPYVALLILPLFAFANAGIPLVGLPLSYLLQPVPLGIMLGLYVGKLVGVFGFSWVTIMLRIGKLPEGSNWACLFGVSALCGVGFTMSLFISSLAAEEAGTALITQHRAGIVSGTLLSAVTGYLVLRLFLRNKQIAE
ncbi:MAG: Na+/H+ antiporter NhaA [Gammaproteobacteria bacterium]|nr:MAG: Na+/H+ antiporter NhaA [Gammaproteobacteria bacterium]